MNLQRQVLLTLRFVKLRRFLGSLFYPLQRDWLELRSRSHNMEVTEETGITEKAKPIKRGGHFYFKHLELEIAFLTPDLIQVDWKPGKAPLPYGIVSKNWEEVEIRFQEKEDCWIISSSALLVIVHTDGSLQFQNSLGQTIREELPPQRRVKLSDTAKGEGWIIKAKLKSDECIYGLGERAAPLNLRTGHPLIRPLFWADTQDSQLWSIEDQFLVGDALLVCPIVSEGATARSVTLPTGYWYNYWNDTLLNGGKQIDSEAPRQQIPLFIKAGSIIPMEEGEKLILHIYPPVKNNFQDNQYGDMESSNITTSSYLYSDGGDGYGEWRLDYLRMIFDSKTLQLVREEQGNFTFPYTTIQ